MRIRKNRKLSSFMPAELIQAYDCQLNQSPWDVISFTEEIETDKSSFHHHFERENNSPTKDASLDNFVGGIIGSDTSLMKRAEKVAIDVEDISLKNIDYNTNNQLGLNKGERSMRCNKTDGKGWQCPDESKQGYSLCDKSDNVRIDTPAASDLICKNSEKMEAATTAPAPARRDRPRRMKKSSTSTSNPHEFYYYSGFGPFWGKKRGEVEDIEGINNSCKLNSTQEKVICIEEEEVDEKEKNNDTNKTEDEIDDNGNENEYSCKKRKKSVKAPSSQST